MITLRATAPGPWGPTGSEFHVKEKSHQQDLYVKNGTLVEVETEADMSPKERAQARAKALGLSTKGTQKEIEDRIAEHEAAPSPADVDSAPGTGVVGPA